jgi:Uma2 family endonuclease
VASAELCASQVGDGAVGVVVGAIGVINLEKSLSQTPLIFEGMTWREFKAVEAILSQPDYRFSFLDRRLAIERGLDGPHKLIKARIGGLLQVYLLAAGFDFTPTGSMTLESESGLVKREADESYRLTEGRKHPDLAIELGSCCANEIVFSSGGINKLEAYKRLKISEVWFWEDGVLEVHHLRGEGEAAGYEKVAQSEVVPGIDLELLRRCITIVNHVEAIKTFQQGIRG